MSSCRPTDRACRRSARRLPQRFPVNQGALCRKGWSAAGLYGGRERLTTPLVRDRATGELSPVSWDDVEALNQVGATVLSRAVVEDPPPDSVLPPQLTQWQASADDAFIAIIVLIVVMALLEVVLLAGPAFAVGARRQSRTLALMAAGGGTPKQSRRVILAGGLVLGVVASVLGVVLGVGVGWALLPVVQRYSDTWLGPFDVTWWHVLLVAGFGMLSAFLAAVVPASIASRQDVVADESHDGDRESSSGGTMTDGDLAGGRASQPRPMRAYNLERDLGTRVPNAHDQDAPFPQLGRTSVVARMQLHDARVEIAGVGGDRGRMVGARRDHDVIGLEPPVPGGDDVPLPKPGQAVDAHPRADGELESLRVCLEVVGHLVLRRERQGGRGEAQPLQAVVACGREQAKGVPARAPRVADPLVRVQDHERSVARRQVVSHGEAGLAAADDHRLEAFGAVVVLGRPVHPSPSGATACLGLPRYASGARARIQHVKRPCRRTPLQWLEWASTGSSFTVPVSTT